MTTEFMQMSQSTVLVKPLPAVLTWEDDNGNSHSEYIDLPFIPKEGDKIRPPRKTDDCIIKRVVWVCDSMRITGGHFLIEASLFYG